MLAVPVRPRLAFAGLRSDDPEDLEARQEPVLAVVLLAGIGGILATPAWHTLMDNPERDAIVVAVFTFIGGGLYGTAGYFMVGGALHLALRSLGTTWTYRTSRHLLALASVPLVLSLAVLPVELAGYGGDAFRSGGPYDGAPGRAFMLIRLAFVAWTLGLVALGIRELEGWPWTRIAGAAGLFVLFLAAILAVPAALL